MAETLDKYAGSQIRIYYTDRKETNYVRTKKYLRSLGITFFEQEWNDLVSLYLQRAYGFADYEDRTLVVATFPDGETADFYNSSDDEVLIKLGEAFS